MGSWNRLFVVTDVLFHLCCCNRVGNLEGIETFLSYRDWEVQDQGSSSRLSIWWGLRLSFQDGIDCCDPKKGARQYPNLRWGEGDKQGGKTHSLQSFYNTANPVHMIHSPQGLMTHNRCPIFDYHSIGNEVSNTWNLVIGQSTAPDQTGIGRDSKFKILILL